MQGEVRNSAASDPPNREAGRAARRAIHAHKADFRLWRTAEADIAKGAIDAIAIALHGIEMLAEPRWHDAVDGDASAAVGIAIRTLLRVRDASESIKDAVMSCLVIHASRGDATSQLLLGHVRDMDDRAGTASLQERGLS